MAKTKQAKTKEAKTKEDTRWIVAVFRDCLSKLPSTHEEASTIPWANKIAKQIEKTTKDIDPLVSSSEKGKFFLAITKGKNKKPIIRVVGMEAGNFSMEAAGALAKIIGAKLK